MSERVRTERGGKIGKQNRMIQAIISFGLSCAGASRFQTIILFWLPLMLALPEFKPLFS